MSKKALMFKNYFSQTSKILMLAAGLSLLAAGCTLKKPKKEVPAPLRSSIKKSFFVELDKKKPAKTFMCGWAPITQAGWIAESYTEFNINMTNHCNLVFQITETELLGLQINPSYPEDPSRWKRTISIPILEHYYYEAALDDFGRKTNANIRNSSRSDWSARPYMTLDLGHIRVFDNEQQPVFGIRGSEGVEILSVHDIEFQEKKNKNFLGFTADFTHPRYGSDYQGSLRFNFLQFAHNKKFKRTPYNEENAKYLNILHVLGTKAEGINQYLYAGHWDTSSKHKVYLKNFPEKYIAMGKEVVDLWNNEFEKIGHGRPFQAVVDSKEMKFSFDLRYTSIYWIQDQKISMYAPLGVGLAQSDVRNGEMLWAAVNLFGGRIEEIINYSKDNKSSSLAGADAKPNMSRLPEFTQLTNFNKGMDDIGAYILSHEKGHDPDFKTDLVEMDAMYKKKEMGFSSFLNLEIFDLMKFIPRAAVVNNDGQSLPFSASQVTPNMALSKEDIQQAVDGLKKSQKSLLFDADLTVGNVIDSMQVGLKSFSKSESLESLSKIYLKEILLHEYGHIMGLGHNFEHNIIPEDGSVPPQYIAAMRKKATKEKAYTQTSTVMGYRDSITTLLDNYKDIVPGPHDRLVLRYLYNSEYPIYNAGDKDFSYVKLETDGLIHEEPKQGYKEAYFPACNDYEASFAMNPYCARWAVGFDAETIVTEYIEEFRQSLPRVMFAMSSLKGKDPQTREWRLWNRALGMMSRVRMFYDYMRLKYANEIKVVAKSEPMLYAFSCACKVDPATHSTANCDDHDNADRYRKLAPEDIKTFDDLFAQKPEFKQLCKANGSVIRELAKFVQMQNSDETIKDHSEDYGTSSMLGGDIEMDDAHTDGDWKQLSGFPIKFSALLNLTTTSPYFLLSNMMIPIDRFSQNAKFTYATLYPFEFTSAMSSMVTSNMQFISSSANFTKMGQIILYFSYFFNQTHFSNDNITLALPGNYWKRLFNQTEFYFDNTIIALQGVRTSRDKQKDRIFRFEGTTYNRATGADERIEYAFLLPNSKIIVKSGNSIILPVTPFYPRKIRLPNGGDWDGYALGYNINYDDGETDVLNGSSLKAKFVSMYLDQLKGCVDSPNGLAGFFKEDEKDYKGIYLPDETAWSSEHRTEFYKSLEENFADYKKKYEASNPVDLKVCEDAMRGLSLIGTAALVINGYFVNEVFDNTIK